MKKIFVLLIGISVLLYSCRKNEPLNLSGQSRVTSGCDCTPPSNNQCGSKQKCVKNFFNNGGYSRIYNVQWTTGCAAFWNSSLKICFNSNCKFQLQFYNLPPCLKDCCLKENVCYETDNFGCGQHKISIHFESTDCNGFAMSFDITGDPDIVITCLDYNGQVFQVKGTLQ
ncbi:MAG: hypothetical protein D6799_05950 [Bacteroidetes bacterium]|nr:MAG: hypothetical protein D6799_05950 [Bacteroidota bacterium]